MNSIKPIKKTSLDVILSHVPVLQVHLSLKKTLYIDASENVNCTVDSLNNQGKILFVSDLKININLSLHFEVKTTSPA